jgi:PAS domain S-box-containing protein
MIPAPPTPDEKERLEALRQTGLLDTLPEQVFDDLTALASTICEAPIALVSLVDESRQWFKSAVGLGARETPREQAFCAHAIHGTEIFVVPDAKEDERFTDNPLVTGDPRIRFYAGAPLITSKGHAIGTLCVIDRVARTLTAAQERALQALARQVRSQIELRLKSAELERQRLFNDAVIENTPCLVTVLDRHGRVVRVNKACEEVSGYAAEDAVGLPFWDVILDHRQKQAARAFFQELRPADFPRCHENEWLTRTGDRRRISWTNNALLDESGQVEFVVSVGIDITERRRAERERDRLFALAPDFMCTLAPDRTYVQVNPTFAAFLGLKPEEAIGRSGDEFTHPADLLRERARAASRSQDESREAEVRVKRHDGEYRWLSWRVSEPSPEGYRFIAGRDVTERHEIDRMKNEFISTVSHELRTPLTAIRGAMGLMEGGVAGPLSDDAATLVQIARSNSDRLVRLINDMLDLEKIEAGRIELQRRPLQVEPVITHALKSIEAMALESGVTLKARMGTIPEVLADEDRLVQVLVNLTSNAIKFSPRDSVVEVGALPTPHGRIRIEIRDHGPGIPEEARSRLFQRFSQLDSSDTRPKGGTGLGLAISKAIVELHGGTIGLDSVPGQGSTFWFELPAQPPVTLPPRSALKTPSPDGRPVLIVEGDEVISKGIARLLAREGYVSQCVTTLDEARRALKQTPPAAILLDPQLPDGGGLDLLRELGADKETGTIPVIIIGASPGENRFGQPIAFDWLGRPVNESALRVALHRAVQRTTKPTVLIVDDDTTLLHVLAVRLQAMGVDCLLARDGDEAIAHARENHPDLIILDVGLPVRDGFEVVQFLRAHEERVTPLIVYTARDLTTADRDALTLGATKYLTKSLTSEEDFLNAVHSLLAGYLPPLVVSRS